MAKGQTDKAARLDLVSMNAPAIVAAMNAKYGANTLVIASKALGLTIKYISTGVFALDCAMGGGWPENRIAELRGPYSSLKTTIVTLSFANFQRKYPNGLAFLIDLEKSFDPAYAKLLGVDLDRLLIVNPDSGEQSVDALADLLSCSVPVFVAVDSLAHITPSAEIEASMDDQFMGLQARLINRMMRVITARTKRSMYDGSQPSTTVLFINQLREKIGVMFGNPETTPGGKGKDFAYSMIVMVRSSASSKIAQEMTMNGIKRLIRFGQKVSFSIVKNKCSSSQFEEGEFEYYIRPYKGYGPFTINNADTLLKYGLYFGLVAIDSKTDTKTYDTISYKAPDAFKKALTASPTVSSSLYTEILDAIYNDNAGNVRDPDEDEEPEEDEDDDEPTPSKKAKVSSVRTVKVVKK